VQTVERLFAFLASGTHDYPDRLANVQWMDRNEVLDRINVNGQEKSNLRSHLPSVATPSGTVDALKCGRLSYPFWGLAEMQQCRRLAECSDSSRFR
jgi:hypothetical protein